MSRVLCVKWKKWCIPCIFAIFSWNLKVCLRFVRRCRVISRVFESNYFAVKFEAFEKNSFDFAKFHSYSWKICLQFFSKFCLTQFDEICFQNVEPDSLQDYQKSKYSSNWIIYEFEWCHFRIENGQKSRKMHSNNSKVQL